MFKRKKGPIVRHLKEQDCTDLVANLTKRRGIESTVELRGSLNHQHLQNPHRQVIAALVRGGLQGKGFETAGRTVDIAFKAAGASIKPAERDKLVHLLDTGILRKK